MANRVGSSSRRLAIMSVSLPLLLMAMTITLGSSSSDSSFARDVLRGSTQPNNDTPIVSHGFMKYLMKDAQPYNEYKDKLKTEGGRILGVNDVRTPSEPSRRHFTESDPTPDPPRGRQLDEDGDEYNYYMDDKVSYDFEGYAFIYAQCQPVQRFSEKAALRGEYSPLITDEIVVFRFCPERRCNADSSSGCLSGYGEYVISMSDYLRAKLYYEMDKRKNVCNFCANCGYRRKLNQNQSHGRRLADDYYAADDVDDYFKYDDAGDDGDDAAAAADDGGDDGDDGGDDYYAADDDDGAAAADDGNDGNNGNDDNGNADADTCTTYSNTCDKYANKCNDGDDDKFDYEDYLDFIDCQQVEKDGKAFYFRPHCDIYKNTIYMGAFYDPYCSQYVGSDVKLSDYFEDGFQKSFFQNLNVKECISCGSNYNPPFYNSNSNFCNRLYADSAKCNTYLAYSIDDDDGTTSNSDLSCSYVESIRYGTYDKDGQIAIYSSSANSQPGEVTAGQIICLVMLIMIITGLSLYSCYLHHSITNFLLTKLTYQGALLPSNMKMKTSRRSKTKDSGRSVSDRSNRSGGSSRRTPKREDMEIA